MNTVVMGTQAAVNWGLIFFGSDNMCGVGTMPNVPIATNNDTAISGAYAANQPSSYTPTESAINAAVAYMKTVNDTNPKYLLLATDGLPNCKPGDRTVNDDDSPGATTAVTNAAAAGLNTFVVGIGNTMGEMTLNGFATAGGEPQTGSADGNSFYEVNSTADLVTALNKIVGIVASCTIPLTGVAPNLTNVAVWVDDASGNTTKVPAGPGRRLVLHWHVDDDDPAQRLVLRQHQERNVLERPVRLLVRQLADLHRQAGQRPMRRRVVTE